MPDSLLNPHRIVRPAVAVLVGAVLAASCRSGAASDATPTTTTLKITTTVSSPPSNETAALDGYRGYWSAYLASSDPMDPANPALAEHATGVALEVVQKSFLALKSAGKVIRGTLDLAPRLVTADKVTATVRDCYGDSTGVFNATTGAREDQPTGQRHLVTATLRLEGGSWKVATLKDEGLGCTAA